MAMAFRRRQILPFSKRTLLVFYLLVTFLKKVGWIALTDFFVWIYTIFEESRVSVFAQNDTCLHRKYTEALALNGLHLALSNQ